MLAHHGITRNGTYKYLQYLGETELKEIGMEQFYSDDSKVFDFGKDQMRRNGVALLVRH